MNILGLGKMISYSQHGEDVLLNRIFKNQKSGFYIDVGANHPVKDSVTKHFYDRGWTGINIEPVSHVFESLRRDRPRDINLNCAVSNYVGTATLFSIPGHSGLSSLMELDDKRLPQGQRHATEVPVVPLAKICTDHARGEISFLKVDVEGAEKSVLESADFKKFRPKVLVVEATKPMTSIPSHEEWEDLLTKSEYLFAHFDGYNRYYVRGEDAALIALFAAPLSPEEYVNFKKAKLARAIQSVKSAIGLA